MRILFLTHSFNSLAQRLFVELGDRGHEVSVEFDINDAVSEQAVALFQPDLIVAPFLKRAVPASIWRHHRCLIVHPGPPGDRGPAALDWAVLTGAEDWGVTVLQAEAEMDAGPVWAHARFAMRDAAKSSLYRHEITEAAVRATLEAVDAIQAGRPAPAAPAVTPSNDGWRPAVTQADRAIDWQADGWRDVLRKVRCADGMPGLRTGIAGRTVHLFDGQPAPGQSGAPGSLIATSGPAVALATHDGALWIGHALDKTAAHPFKLPARQVLARETAGLPETPLDSDGGYRQIRYEEQRAVGILHFDFYNGAMATDDCQRLLAAYDDARRRDTRVIVLAGGAEFWSNGLNLNRIEAAESAADESWRNINAIDDLAEAILRTESHLTVAALRGNAGAGGVFLARACDAVWMRRGVILNPHYKDMGNLHGSEFWTYSLPAHAGAENARKVTQARLPVGAREARTLGLADDVFDADHEDFMTTVQDRAAALAGDKEWTHRIADKARRRAADEAAKPLAQYRAEELERMRLNFYGFDPSYHIARYNFVAKVAKSRTPVTIARHRKTGADARRRKAS